MSYTKSITKNKKRKMREQRALRSKREPKGKAKPGVKATAKAAGGKAVAPSAPAAKAAGAKSGGPAASGAGAPAGRPGGGARPGGSKKGSRRSSLSQRRGPDGELLAPGDLLLPGGAQRPEEIQDLLRGRRARPRRLQPVPPWPRPAREHDRGADHRRRADAAPPARPHAERLALRHRAPANPVTEPTPAPPFGEEPLRERQTVPFLVLQFFVFPLAIVAVCVAVFVVFGLIAGESKGARDYLAEVRSGGANRRWQAAFELSKVLQAGRDK